MTDLEQIELEIKSEEDKLALVESLAFLEKNKHYKRLISEAYLKNYALSILTFKASIQAQEAKVQSHVDYQLAGVAGFQQFIANVRQTGAISKETIHNAKIEREHLLQEEG